MLQLVQNPHDVDLAEMPKENTIHDYTEEIYKQPKTNVRGRH